MGELAAQAIRDFERRKGDRGTTEQHWQEVADLTVPDRNDYIVDKAPGQKRMTKIFDSMPVLAVEQASAGWHSMMSSTSLQWFYLLTEDDRLNLGDRVQTWLESAAARMYALFSSPRRNFASQSHELYRDDVSIGTACMAVLDSAKNDVLFSTRHMKECVIAEDNEDRINSNIRNWQWTAAQAVEEWGLDALKRAGCDDICKAYVETPDKKFRFLHDVRPRRLRNALRSDAKHKAFQSVYVSVDNKAEITIGGFDEFPYLVPRMSKVTGEVYGRGLGMLNLPDIKMLNELVKIVLKAAQKVVDPPLQVPDDGFLVPIKTVPGAFNYYRATSQARIEPIKTGGQIELGVELVNALRQQILKGFYIEWMQMPTDAKDPAGAGKGITATYVNQTRDDRWQFMSPFLARMQSEFLGPLIDRVFAMLWRKSLALKFGPGAPFPLPPPELRGVPLRVEYVSPMALAQRTAQMDGITRLMQLQMQIRTMDPQSMLLIDPDFILRTAQRDWNAPAGAVKSPQRLQQEQADAAQAAQAAQAHDQIASLAGAAKDGSAAVKNISDVRQAVQPQAAQPQQQRAA